MDDLSGLLGDEEPDGMATARVAALYVVHQHLVGDQVGFGALVGGVSPVLLTAALCELVESFGTERMGWDRDAFLLWLVDAMAACG